MRDIKNLNIWKEENTEKVSNQGYMDLEIAELNLSVRSYNCLKRAGCHKVRDILSFMDEEGQGLRKIRNLGLRSEKEIIERIEEMKEIYRKQNPDNPTKQRKIIKPRKSIWDRKIEEYHLSKQSIMCLKKCGIERIRDLYLTNPRQEPGWYAVRELFEKIR